MASDLEKTPSGDRLALLYHLAQTFNSTLDLDQVLNRVMDEVIVATRAERGFVMLRESGGRLVFRAARGIDQQTIDDPAFQVSRSVVEKVALEGKAILTYDAQTDSRFNMRQSVVILGLRSVLCVPLALKDNILGVIYVDNRLQAGIFTLSDQELLGAIASNAAIAIENARLYRLAVEKGRLERELQMAREVQVSLLPREIPDIPGWEFASRWLPARQVSGDFYDFLTSNSNQPDLVIADVSDKGMPAALFMGLSRTILRASLDQARSPRASIERANRLICADSANSMFVTMFYAQINQRAGEITYVNAGHNPPLVFHNGLPEGHRVRWLSKTGMALGVLPDNVYAQQTVRLNPGDFMILYTDGVVDTENSRGEPFGVDRLQAVILEHSTQPVGQIIEELEQALAKHAGEHEPFDDITLLAIRRL
jgi:sigma-B regulation protein RsbU (phosphoserine phosphatase)